jgi:hypothetical protein
MEVRGAPGTVQRRIQAHLQGHTSPQREVSQLQHLWSLGTRLQEAQEIEKGGEEGGGKFG